MGTRSETYVLMDGRDTSPVVRMYGQWDGYLGGHGVDLFDFLEGMEIVNGISGKPPEKYANGMDCLAAQLVAHFKTTPGSFYLYPPWESALIGQEEYTYIIFLQEDNLHLAAYSGSMEMFSKPVSELTKNDFAE